MSLLFETLRIQDRNLRNIAFHNERMNRTRRELFGSEHEINLAHVISIPEYLSDNIYKCKVIYARDIVDIIFTEYLPKSVRTLHIVDGGEIDYCYKWIDRSAIDRLLLSVTTDDIIIIRKGYVTDASYANIALFDGQRWITPSTPLLRGTMRENLIRRGFLREQLITCEELFSMKSVRLINAMLDFNSSPDIPVENIYL